MHLHDYHHGHTHGHGLDDDNHGHEPHHRKRDMSDREEDITTVARYHERTEHRLPNRFAASLGYLDWETQPDPFRFHHGTESLHLPLAEPSEPGGPSWASIRSSANAAPTPLDIHSFSQLFYDSMAISAWKRAGSSTWALRCNPSSGNLHPTEAYVLAGPISGLTSDPALLHYAPKDHAVEVLRSIAPSDLDELSRQLLEGAFVVGLSSILWREAWKYGERAFRYCMHDVGHAMQALTVAARVLGWRVRRIEGLDSNQLNRLCATDRTEAPELERADLLLAIETAPTDEHGPVQLTLSEPAVEALCPPAAGVPNELSSEHHDWPILEVVEQATQDVGSPHGEPDEQRPGQALEDDPTSPSARVLARNRRSAVDFDGHTGMTSEQLYRMLATLVPRLTPCLWTTFPHRPRVHPLFLLHRIQGLEPGLAILVRDPDAEPALRSAFTRVDEWKRLPGCPSGLPLFGLAAGDMRHPGRIAHCMQDIGSDGALVVSMIASFQGELERFGAAAYRHLHWEAGAVGQLLYLEAEAISLSATGIGCFFDHAIHEGLGLPDSRFRMLYGTALGRAVLDSRLQTLPAYERADATQRP